MSTRILILKDGVITPSKNSSDIDSIRNSLGVVDLTTNQTISGIKTFSSSLNISQLFSGYVSSTSNKAFSNSDFLNPAIGKIFNFIGGDYTPSIDPGTTWAGFATDITTNGAVNLTSLSTGGFFRFRHFGTSTISTAQGIRLVGLNSSTGTITNLTGGSFVANNSSSGTVTNLTGGDFTATCTGSGIVNNLIGGKFTATITNASATTSTLIGGQFIVGSNNTVAAISAIGIDIANITGTATTKIPLRVGTGGSSFFNDTTASTSTTTGALIVAGGIAAGGTINSIILNATTQINIATTKVLGIRDVGWTAPTGTTNKGAFASDTATLLDVARRLFSLETALRTHGLIGT